MKKQIVFAETNTTAWTFKLAKALKEKGYETVLISMMPYDSKIEYNNQAFDQIISFNGKFLKVDIRNLLNIAIYSISKSRDILNALRKIRKLRPYVVIGRAPPSWGCIFFKFLFRKYPFVYFPYDIRSFGFKSMKQANDFGVPTFEIKAEKYCFENSDGIYHKGDENELKDLSKELLGDVKINVPVIHFPPYCIKEFILPINKDKFSKKDKGFHIAFVGHIVTEGDEKVSWQKPIEEMLSQKIHLHMIGKSGNLSDEELKRKFDKGDLAKFVGNKYFHVKIGTMGFKDLINEISRCDFGIWMGYGHEDTKHIGYGSGNKLASFLEAGLPFIYHKNHWYIDKVMTHYGLKLAVAPSDFKNLKKILKKIDYKKYLKNVEKARNDFELGKNLPRLEAFFEAVAKKEKGYREF